jgi:hypothetical protein
VGRFISEDPLAFDGGDNFYVYANNSPTYFSDPLGLAPTVAPAPVVSPWTAAEEAAYQAFVRGLQGTSRFLSNVGTGITVVFYLGNPSSGNNTQWAKSREFEFEQQAQSSSAGGRCGGNDPCKNIRARLMEHQEKLFQYASDPYAFDNLGILKKGYDQRIIAGRVRHLVQEILEFQKQLEECERKHGLR